MNSKKEPKSTSISERVLRSNSASSISFESSSRKTNHHDSHDRSKLNKTSTPILGRKITKSNGRRSNSVKPSSNSTKPKKRVLLVGDKENNRSTDHDVEMHPDSPDQGIEPNVDTDIPVSDLTINDTGLNNNRSEQENRLNDSEESVDEDYSTKRTTTAKKTDVMHYFEKQTGGGFKCTLCKNPDKIFSGNNEHSDSNLRSHLGKAHKMAKFLYPSQRKQYHFNAKTIDSGVRKTLNAAAIEAIVQDGLPFNHFRKPGMAHFLSIIKPGYVGPHRKTVRKHLSRLYHQRRAFMKQKLSQVLCVSFTTDVWRNSKRDYFICLTCHFLTDTYENESFVLAFRRVQGKHSAIKFRAFIRNEIIKMNLYQKVCSITTDNAPDITAATEDVPEFGVRISCSAHNINLVLQRSLRLFGKGAAKKSKSLPNTTVSEPVTFSEDHDESVSFNEWEEAEIEDDVSDKDYESINSDDTDQSEDSSTEFLSNDEEISDDSSESEDSDEDEESMSSQSRANSQRQSDDHGLDELAADPDRLISCVFKLLKRARSLVKFVHQSNPIDRYIHQQIVLKQNELNKRAEEQKTTPIKLHDLVLDFIVRWNTTFIMLSRFITISSIITDITLSPSIELGLRKEQYEKLRKLSFTRLDWLLLTALQNVLAPFYETTKIISGSKYPTLSLAFSVLVALKNFLTTCKSDQVLENALKKIMLLQFNYYCDRQISSKQKRVILIAAFLDPTSYRLLSDNEITVAEQHIMHELDGHQSLIDLHLQRPAHSFGKTAANNTRGAKVFSIEKLYDMCEMPELPASSINYSKHLSSKEEICRYMSTVREIPKSTTFSQYWCQNEMLLPNLSKLAKCYNCIPCTSVPSESAFSVAGFLQRKNRSSLSSTALRYSMVLRK